MSDSQTLADVVFNSCKEINALLATKNDNAAREELIQLLDFHLQNEIKYSELVNHLIRQSGLYPYLDKETSGWKERFVFDAFKADVGYEEPVTLHRDQSLLLKRLINGDSIAVSGPTSFGKSFVIDAYIKLKKPVNVMIIVPTIALTDETRRRIFRKFSKDYKVITTTDVVLAEKNILIFPQERALSYLSQLNNIDLLVVDEFYKAGKKFDPQRSPSLVKAMIKLGTIAKQRYYLAPNISSIDDNPFTKDMDFLRLDFSTVFLQKHDVYKGIKNPKEKGIALVKILGYKETKSLIYAGNYAEIERVSTLIMDAYPLKTDDLLIQFSNWLGKNYDPNWSLTKLIQRGTGVHNGRLHRSLSQIQVKLFSDADSGLINLVSTSSIIEGVNTAAENVIIWRNRKGASKLDDFTYRNIIGRSGRMFKYFIGKVYILEEPPKNVRTQLDIPFPDEIVGDLDEKKHGAVMTDGQIQKLRDYETEMSVLLGADRFKKLKDEAAFQTSNTDVIKEIAQSMIDEPRSWKGLSFLNDTRKAENWDHYLYKMLKFQGGNWEDTYKTLVTFIKLLRHNWKKSIPEMLEELSDFDIGLDKFFRLERVVTFKLTSLVKDVNTLQKVLLPYNYDVSKFISRISHAFLPSIVYQLEEYGLPRMMTKRLHEAQLIDTLQIDLSIHDVIDKFNEIGEETILKSMEWDPFERYILRYFFDGIK